RRPRKDAPSLRVRGASGRPRPRGALLPRDPPHGPRGAPVSTTSGTQPASARPAPRRLRDFSPSAAADEELTWFFNKAEIAIDQPSNFQALLSGAAPTSLEQVERRAEAMHAARKIQERL